MCLCCGFFFFLLASFILDIGKNTEVNVKRKRKKAKEKKTENRKANAISFNIMMT